MITKFKTILTALFVVIGTATASSATGTDPNDFTYLINNPAYLHKGADGTADYDGWTLSPELPDGKKRNYEVMNLITYSGNVDFTIKQTISSVPAGIYRLSVYGFYRPGSVADEADRVANGEPVHNLALFATIGKETFTTDIMNLYEGAQPEDIIGKNFHPKVAGYESFYCPDGASDSRAFYLQGCYRNDLVITVPEDGPVTIGVNHPDGMTYDSDYAPIGGWELYKIGEVKASEDLAYEREIGQGYGPNSYTVDFSKALEFLEADNVKDVTLCVVNPDGTEIKEYSTFDGWFDGDGVPTQWGATTKICVKFFQAIPNGKFEVCDMNGADAKNAETGKYNAYTVHWALKANSKTYTYNITIQFVEPKPVVAEVVETILIKHDELEKTAYSSTFETVDVEEVCKALGINDISEAKYMVAIPDGTGGYTYENSTTDGWRNAADGAQKGWGTAGGICVKVWETNNQALGNVSYIGCFDDSHLAGESYHFYYAFIANNKIVIYDIQINFVSELGTGINTTKATAAKGQVFDLSGRKVISDQLPKGINIINGTKTYVK